MWCDFGANLVQHFMLAYSRCSRYQTVLSKLEEIICALRQLFQYAKSSASAGLFVFYKAVLFTFGELYGIITLGSYLLDKLEFVGENDENLIYDWRYYGGWKNNCVPTA